MKHILFRTWVIIPILLCVALGLFLYTSMVYPSALFDSSQNQINKVVPEEILDDHFALGEYYFNQPPYNFGVYDLEKAKYHYSQAIADAIATAEPIPLYAWYNLARVDFVQAKNDQTIFKLEQQLAVHGDAVPQTYYMLGLTYGYQALKTDSDSDWQAAETAFLKFMEYAPNSPWPRVDLAWVYFGQGKFAEMLPLLEEGIAINDNHAWLLNTYGLALLNTGDKSGAREAFIQAQKAYRDLSVEDWQNAYIENDPSYWNRNFELFGATIAYNLSLVE